MNAARWLFRTGRLLAILSLLAGAFGRAPSHAATEARHVILFQGDGMGQMHVRAGAYYVCGVQPCLAFESFPNLTAMTAANASGQITDSAASATAMATGVKVTNDVVSVRLPGDGGELRTLLEIYRDRGLSTGLVTTSYMTDASPAAYGAHAVSRENTAEINSDYLTQTRPNVLLGGGGSRFDSGRAADLGWTVVADREALLAADTESLSRLAGGFGTGYIPPVGYPGRSTSLPSLPEMTRQALRVLDNDPEGLFLFVEHEGTDEYASDHDSTNMVRSMAELSDAVQAAVDWVDDPNSDADWSNTLIVVVGDHETGGISEVVSKGAGSVPAIRWTDESHTGIPVGVYARGAGAAQITGAQIDNTAIFSLLSPSGGTECMSVSLAAGADTWMNPREPGTPNGGDTKLGVDGSPDSGALIRWDLSAIPPGSNITYAGVTFSVPDANDPSDSRYPLYAVRREWSEAHATWTQAEPGIAWGTPGAQNTSTDRYDTVLAYTPIGGTAPTHLTAPLYSEGLAQIKRWVDGADPNHGFAIQDYADAQSNGFGFSSFDSADPPTLVVHYCPPAGPIPLPYDRYLPVMIRLE